MNLVRITYMQVKHGWGDLSFKVRSQIIELKDDEVAYGPETKEVSDLTRPLTNLMTKLDELKEGGIPEGKYLEMCNLLKLVFQRLKEKEEEKEGDEPEGWWERWKKSFMYKKDFKKWSGDGDFMDNVPLIRTKCGGELELAYIFHKCECLADGGD